VTRSGTLPFADAGPSEVLARVTYRYIEMCYRRRLNPWYDPAWEVARLRESWADREPPIGLAFWLTAFAAAIKRNMTSRAYRDGVIERSRAGLHFRHCSSWDYKGTRRGPRVTNRGARPDRSKGAGNV
jgi:hypothetical protein